MSYLQANSATFQRESKNLITGLSSSSASESASTVKPYLSIPWSGRQGFGLFIDATASPAPRRFDPPIPQPRPSTGRDLMRFLGTWVGDDLEDRLLDVYETRGEVSW